MGIFTQSPGVGRQSRPQSAAEAKRRLWRDDSALASTLVALFVAEYGTGVLSGEDAWTPESMRYQLATDLHVALTDEAIAKLMAGISILTSNEFYRDLHKFIAICNALDGTGVSPDVFDPADSQEMAWAVHEAALLSPPDPKDPEDNGQFSDEIREYMRQTLQWEGLLAPPANLLSHTGDLSAALLEFDDDPELYSSMYQLQDDRRKEIDDWVAQRDAELRQQLEAVKALI